MRGLIEAGLVLVFFISSPTFSPGIDIEEPGVSGSTRFGIEPIHSTISAEGATRSPATFDLIHYDVNVTVQPTLSQMNCTSIVAVAFSEDTANLTFDLALTPFNVSLADGDAMTYEYAPDNAGDYHLVVHSGGHFVQGTTLELVIGYAGSPNAGNIDHIGVEGSWLQRGESWYPRAHRADPNASFDRFTADINVTVPTGRVAVSNGELILTRVPSPGNLTFYWQSLQPAVSLSFAEGVLNKTAVMHNGVIVEVYFFPRHDQLKWSYLDEMNKTLDFYQSVFSSYPYPKLALVEIPSVFAYGSACLQSFFVIQTRILDDFTLAEGPLPHEIAHQWWGQMVAGLGDEALWLQEGFAQYSADLYGEHQYQNRSRLWEQKSVYYMTNPSPSEGSVADGYSVYYKGPWILHMLRYVLGNATFFDAMNRFAADNTFSGGVMIADIQRVSEEVSGRDLGWFFQEWLYGTGHLNIEVTSARCLQQRDGTCLVEIEIHRNEDIVMPVDVGFTAVNGSTTVMEKYVNLTSTDITVSFSADAQVTNVDFDPQGWLLARFSTVNVSFVQYHRPILEEPMFWISAILSMILVIALITLVRRRRGRRELSQKP